MKKEVIVGLCALSMSNVTVSASLKQDKVILQQNLFEAIQAGTQGEVKSLLTARASLHDTNSGGSTPLYCAVLFGHDKLVKFLLEAGAHVNVGNTIHNNTPLHLAVEEENEKMITLLLGRNADASLPNKEGLTPQYIAQHNEALKRLFTTRTSDKGDERAQRLQERGDKKENKDTEKRGDIVKEPQNEAQRKLDEQLFQAVQNKRSLEIRKLIFNGANVNAQDSDGQTPLHWAAYLNYAGVTRALIEKGARIEARNKGGLRPLHQAAALGNVAIVDILLNRGAEVNATDNKGYTPLTYAHAGKPGKKAKTIKILRQRGGRT